MRLTAVEQAGRSSTDGVALLLNPSLSPELAASTVGGYAGVRELEMSGSDAPMAQQPQENTKQNAQHTQDAHRNQGVPPMREPPQRYHTNKHSTANHEPDHHASQHQDLAPHAFRTPTLAMRTGNVSNVGTGYSHMSRDGASPGTVRERLFQRCVKKIRGLQILEAFNTWVANMRSDRSFLDSKLYTKLVGQLAKERVRNVDLERSLREVREQRDGHMNVSNSPDFDKDMRNKALREQNAVSHQHERELAAKQERITKLENIHKDSVERLVRERVSLHLGALADQAGNDTTHEVEHLQQQLEYQHQQFETSAQHISALEAHVARLSSTRSPSLGLHSPVKSILDDGNDEVISMQMATAEVNASVARLVEILHADLRERGTTHGAIMTCIANTVALRCAADPPISSPTSQLGPTGCSTPQSNLSPKPHANNFMNMSNTIFNGDVTRSPVAVPVTHFDTASVASETSTSSQTSSSTGNLGRASPDVVAAPATQAISDLEKRHSSIMALAAKVRVS